MKKLIALNLVGLALVVGLAAWLLQNARSSSRALREVGEFTAVQRDADEIRTQMITMSDAMRGFLLNPSNREEFERKRAADRALAQAVDRLMSETDDATYVQLARSIGNLDQLKLDRIEDRVLDLTARDPKAASAAYFGEYLPVRNEQMALVEKLRTLATDALAAEVTQAGGAMSWTASLVAWMGAIVVLIMLGAFAWSARTTRHVQARIASETATMFEAANGVLDAARIASQSAHSLSQGASQQAASLEETSASMTEMASVTRRNAENSQDAAVLMTSMDNHVRVSNAALNEMVASMKALQGSSEQVARIIKTIDGIAFQTNLLALNAAVEAARAGDAGMGFAIVADEVRSLAQRSAQAAKDTEALIESSLEKTAHGNEKVTQVAAAMADITACVVSVKGLVESVNQASQRQSHGIDQVAQAVVQMEKITQTNAATAEESAASGEELHAKAQTALEVVRRLEILVDVKRATAAAPGAAFTAPSGRTLAGTRRAAATPSRRAA